MYILNVFTDYSHPCWSGLTNYCIIFYQVISTDKPRCVLIQIVQYGHPKKSAQLIFLEHF